MPVATDPRSVIDDAKQNAESGKERFLRTFSFVPDDKLDYSPSTTAKSPLRLAAHVGLSNYTFASIIRGDQMPDLAPDQILAQLSESETRIDTREKAIQTIEDSHREIVTAIDGVNPDAIDREIKTPVVDAPMRFWINLPGLHMFGHAGQLDYVQTIWGDLDPHF